MLDTNSEYIVLRYQRAPRYQQNESSVWYSSNPENRKEQYREQLPDRRGHNQDIPPYRLNTRPPDEPQRVELAGRLDCHPPNYAQHLPERHEHRLRQLNMLGRHCLITTLRGYARSPHRRPQASMPPLRRPPAAPLRPQPRPAGLPLSGVRPPSYPGRQIHQAWAAGTSPCHNSA